MGKNFYSLICFLILLSANAQTAQIEGRVTDAEGRPLVGATVLIQEKNVSSITDVNGKFTFAGLDPGKLTVFAQMPGYSASRKVVEISDNQKLTMNFELEEVTLLSEVNVIDRQTGLSAKTTYSVANIPAKEIEWKGPPGGLMAIAQQDPAVYGAEMGQGIVKPFIRGLGFSRVVTIYQGNKLENHQWGADHGLGLNDLGVASLDIIKGPSSILYGSGALGGVILVKDDESFLQKRGFSGSAGFTLNSVSTGYRPYFTLAHTWDNGWFAAAEAAFESHGDYLDGNGRAVGNSRFETFTGRLHVGVDKARFKNKLSYTAHHQTLGIIEDDEMEPGQTLATHRWDRSVQLPFQRVADHVVSYRQSSLHGRWLLALNASHHFNDRREIEDDFDEVDLGLSQNHTFYNVRATHSTNENWENTFGLQGSFIRNRNREDAEEILIPNANVSEQGLYFLTGYSSGKWHFEAGARYDVRHVSANARQAIFEEYGYNLPGNPDSRTHEVLYNGATGSLGTSYSLTGKQKVKINLSTGYRAPDLAELYSNGPHPGTNRFEVGNTNFEREQSYQADLGYSFVSNDFQVHLNAFFNRVDGFVFFAGTGQFLPSGLEVWSFEQTDANLYGLEAQASYRPMGSRQWLISGRANFIRGEEVGTNRPMTFIPPSNAALEAKYSPEWTKKFSFFSTTRFVMRQDRPGLNEQPTPEYWLLNAGISHKTNFGKTQMETALTAFNLLNRAYVDHMSILRAFNVPNPGRNLMFNVRFSW